MRLAGELRVADQLAMIVLTLGSFQVAQGLKLQQLSLAVSALLAAAVALATAGQLLTAGAFLALALIKPQLSLPLLAWLLVWASADLKNRWRLVAGFGIAAAVLVAGAEIVLPGWIGRFQDAVIAYRQYTGGAVSLPEMLLGPFAGRLVDMFLILACAVPGWFFRQETTRLARILSSDRPCAGSDGGDRSHGCAVQPGFADSGSAAARPLARKASTRGQIYAIHSTTHVVVGHLAMDRDRFAGDCCGGTPDLHFAETLVPPFA